MKTITTILLFAAMITVINAQTIRRVNNNPGVTGTNIYSTIQAAHDDAASGDIIYVEPSYVGYGQLTCTKNLKIYGSGYFLDKNLQLSVNPLSTQISGVDFLSGSSNSEIAGFYVSGNINIYDSNIKVFRNGFYGTGGNINVSAYVNPGPVYTNISNINISQNYLTVDSGISISGAMPSSTVYSVSSVIVSNNYLGYGFTTNQYVTGVLFKNNIMGNGSSYYPAIFVGYNASIENNIFRSYVANNPLDNLYNAGLDNAAINCSISNNIAEGSILPTGNGNQNNQVIINEFVGSASLNDEDALNQTTSPDSRWQLKPNSSLKTAGSGGSEVGIFGGSDPYVISGIPPIPSIPNLYVTPTGNNTTPLSVTISTKSNN